MPKVLLTKAQRDAEANRKRNEAFLEKMAGKMAVRGISKTDMAESLQCSRTSLWSKQKDPSQFSVAEIRIIADRLKMEPAEVMVLFQ